MPIFLNLELIYFYFFSLHLYFFDVFFFLLEIITPIQNKNFSIFFLFNFFYTFSQNMSTFFAIKFLFCIFFLILIRGGTPRYRYDYLTKLGWLKFLSLTIFLFLSIIFIFFFY